MNTKPEAFYVMHAVDGDECCIAYCQEKAEAVERMRAEANRLPHADFSVWSSRGEMLYMLGRGVFMDVSAERS